MAAYFQMGHDTENLIGERDLCEYKGIVLSPMNRKKDLLVRNIDIARGKGAFDIIFDPQLYFPRANRGVLQSHHYFPKDLETADLSSEAWWLNLTRDLAEYTAELKVDGVASPVVLPRIWSDEYYGMCAAVSRCLTEQLAGAGIRSWATLMVNLDHTSEESKALRTASIIAEAEPEGYYIVLDTDVDPRRELEDEKGLYGVMILINELSKTGVPVLVSHCASDMLLFKVAGATHCATGKFFNLRRFTESRFEEPAGGGGQLPYWFEHGLLAFLRGPDVLRLGERGFDFMVGVGPSNNSWASEILEKLRTDRKEPWLAAGWRQYLSWFCSAEAALSGEDAAQVAMSWLKSAETNWLTLDDAGFLMDEVRNAGSWIRPWRQAVNAFVRREDGGMR